MEAIRLHKLIEKDGQIMLKDLLEKINAAYDDQPDQDELNLLNRMKIRHKSIVEEQW